LVTDPNNEIDSTSYAQTPETKFFRQKPTKTLPTDRLSFDKQTLILRGIVKASLAADRGSISNSDAAQYADVAPSSVSLCNAFFSDCGLTIREGVKIRPADVVFEFDTAAQWEPDTAAHKLSPVIANTWFAKAILTKLALKPSIPTTEALSFLAQQCNAPLDYKPQLAMLLEYLSASGLIVLEGALVSVATRGVTPAPSQNQEPAPVIHRSVEISQVSVPLSSAKRITIALPDKDDVVIEIPQDFEADDWILVADQLVGYIKRWKKFATTKELRGATQEDDAGNGSSGP
jgi:hypothetical protein